MPRSAVINKTHPLITTHTCMFLWLEVQTHTLWYQYDLVNGRRIHFFIVKEATEWGQENKQSKQRKQNSLQNAAGLANSSGDDLEIQRPDRVCVFDNLTTVKSLRQGILLQDCIYFRSLARLALWCKSELLKLMQKKLYLSPFPSVWPHALFARTDKKFMAGIMRNTCFS